LVSKEENGNQKKYLGVCLVPGDNRIVSENIFMHIFINLKDIIKNSFYFIKSIADLTLLLYLMMNMHVHYYISLVQHTLIVL
jgi:hypothetical protein